MFSGNNPSISLKKVEQVFKVFTKLQKENPRKCVTPKDLGKGELKLSRRTIERALVKLLDSGRIEKPQRGQYWLPSYLEKNKKYLRYLLESEKITSEFWSNECIDLNEKIGELKLKIMQMEMREPDHQLENEKEGIIKQLKNEGVI